MVYLRFHHISLNSKSSTAKTLSLPPWLRKKNTLDFSQLLFKFRGKKIKNEIFNKMKPRFNDFMVRGNVNIIDNNKFLLLLKTTNIVICFILKYYIYKFTLYVLTFIANTRCIRHPSLNPDDILY